MEPWTADAEGFKRGIIFLLPACSRHFPGGVITRGADWLVLLGRDRSDLYGSSAERIVRGYSRIQMNGKHVSVKKGSAKWLY